MKALLYFLLCTLIIFAVFYRKIRYRNNNSNIATIYSSIEQDSDAIFILDRNGKIIDGNSSIKRVFGYELGEVNEQSFLSLLDSKHHTLFSLQFGQSIIGKTKEVQVHGFHKNGTILILTLKCIPFLNQKKYPCVFVVIQDITEQDRARKNLHKTNEQLTYFLNHTVDAINITNLNSEIVYVNPAFEKMFGWSKEEILGKFLPIVPPNLKEVEEQKRQSLLNGETINNWEEQFIRKDGSQIYVNTSISTLKDEHGNIDGFAAITRDISKRKKAEERLRASEEKYRLIAENSTDLIRIVDKSGLVLYASPSHKILLGFEPKELEGEHFQMDVHPDDSPRILKMYEKMKRNPQPTTMVYRRQHKYGHYIDVEANCSPFLNENNELSHYIVVTRDISERRQYEKELKRLAYYDSLTKVRNRRYFHDQLVHTLNESENKNKQFALLYLDCDRFKWVNDTMGHDIGDSLLKEIVTRIKAEIPSPDSIYRLGGDEFAVILSDIHSKEQIASIAEGIISALQSPWVINEHRFVTTSSIGISMYPKNGLDKHTLISHADQALYQAKQAGRNSYKFYTDELERKFDRLVLLENDLKQAIRNEEFQLAYQPQVNIRTGITNCLEVLLRYKHPVLGNIGPDEFIPICERTGLIDEITIWIIKQVGYEYQNLIEKGYSSVKFAINLSPNSLRTQTNTMQIVKAIKEANIPPNLLEFEITELAFLENLDEISQRLSELKQLGVSVSLDDFGSGYSSLIYFKQLPIDKIKIDKTFIQDVGNEDGKKAQTVINAVLFLAKELQLEVVCEGVETEEQLIYLLKNNLLYAQGYYFSKPVSEKALEQLRFMETKETGEKVLYF
ncbi:bifunctional diguanylate cyclase/phosphodiesterase [Robertmurraya yapensis]|uniref:Bifunctional diguanylate cyclase/phosphodiesterase n=1 Tax=Bacillus yapensis TaxID=2492960 RepID=A0A3S0IIN8_9BACI|nr:bifunctional diguanylate cyclase/phosphodiesterase [Bacillus yapensis]RTR36169.1 bifunctional diguanylate cyclase/phosphodiesterase [Bacillus yapensis]TKT05672.1 PAS domain S-box protein [Bacillus yapensis]